MSKRSGIPSTQQQKAARSHLRERKPWAEFSYHWLFTLLCCSKMRSNASRREQQAAVHHPWPAPWRPPCRGAKKQTTPQAPPPSPRQFRSAIPDGCDLGAYGRDYLALAEMTSRPKRGRGMRVRRWFSQVKKFFRSPIRASAFQQGAFGDRTKAHLFFRSFDKRHPDD